MEKRLYDHLAFLYGEDRAGLLTRRLWEQLASFRTEHPEMTAVSAPQRINEKDAILITYGDMVQQPGQKPLATLADFLPRWLNGCISAIHLLPFFPYSSDDGFSVIDYQQVNPAWGDWADVAAIGRSFRLMFDAVINHVSAQSDWFQAFLRGERPYTGYFITVDPAADLSAVFRPRSTPLLTPFETASGVKYVWTTFSEDQVDLNYANPAVLFAALDTLLFYAARGAEFIRLDAVAYIWKEIGTNCLHRPQTHEIIRLMRAALDIAAPRVSLITETNVPHEENIAYFGDGRNEAQMVYNFSLPPLTLHAFHTGNAETLSQWAAGLKTPSAQTAFFNFLASHDGIGVQPAKGLLSDTAVAAMAARVEALGGYVSYKTNRDGSQSPYELNINYLDALGDPDRPDEPVARQARRFLAAQAIMLALRGVPGIYFHSLFGSRNWREGVEITERKRAINRQKLQRALLERELADPLSLRRQIFTGYQKLLFARAADSAFHPNGGQKIVACHPAVFALWRTSPDGRSRVLCLQNVSDQPREFALPVTGAPRLVDLLGAGDFPVNQNSLHLTIPPYGILWLKKV